VAVLGLRYAPARLYSYRTLHQTRGCVSLPAFLIIVLVVVVVLVLDFRYEGKNGFGFEKTVIDRTNQSN
jgi:hypothetical protein